MVLGDAKEFSQTGQVRSSQTTSLLRTATVRPFLALPGESKVLDAASAGKVLAGVRGLPALARRKVGVKPLLPREVDDKLVPPAWRKAVCTPTPICRRVRWTGTRTWCACWSICTGP